MYSNKALVRLVALVISIPLVVLGAIVSVVGQTPPNQPPPGAYVPIPNYTGVGAGALFRRAINDRFSGAQRIAPAIATASFANLPAEQDGMMIYCPDCKLTSPCAGSGTGAWALGARGQWSCSDGILEANLNANGNKMTNLANGTVAGDALDFGQPAGSDLSGSFPNPIVQTVLGGKTPAYLTEANPPFNDSALPATGTATKVQGAPAANITLNKPSSVVSGHTMIMAYFSQSSTAPTPPSGWTLIRSDSCSGGAMASYYKVAGSSEPSTYTWTLASSYYSATLIDVGVTASNPVDAISPAVCSATPALAGLTTSAQPENVIVLGAAVNSNINQVGFSQGTLVVLQPGSGVLPLSAALLTANYPTTPSVTLTGTGANETAQMIAIKRANTYTGAPVLQGDGYAELTNLAGTFGRNDSISGFNIDGRINVQNPAYGAKGDGVTDDNAAITAAYAAACASASGPNNVSLAAVYLPKPSNCYHLSEPLVLSCGFPVQVYSDSDLTAAICANNDFPMIVSVPSNYMAQSIGTISAPSLVPGPGAAMNFASATPWYLNLDDAMANFFGHAYPLNGLSQIDVRLFFNVGSLATAQNFFWMGGDPAITAPDCSGSGGSVGAEASLCLSGNGALCYQLTTGGVSHRACGASSAVAINTTHEAEMAYNGSNVYVFLDGTQISGSPFAQTGTVTQTPWTDILVGMSVQAYPDWGDVLFKYVGQMDSYQISNVARHTANYAMDSAKFSNDSNTLLLINGTTFNNPLIAADKSENATDGWLIARGFGPQGAATKFRNLSINGGTIGIFQALEPGTKYDNVTFTTGNIGLELWNNTYEGLFNNLVFSMGNTSEAAITAAGAANAETFIAPHIINTGYHAIEGFDLSAHILNPFISPDQNSVDGFYDNCDNDFCGVSLLEPIDDVENGGSAIPFNIFGSGNYSVFSGNLTGGAGAPCVQVQPANSGNKINLNIYGTTCNTNAPSPAELINFVGSNPLKTPVTWYSPTANGLSYSAQTAIPWTNVPADLIVYGDVMQPPVKTVATLPTCNSGAKGQSVQISDCNANCTTYLGTTFTGGGSTRSTVQCNGTAWELH